MPLRKIHQLCCDINLSRNEYITDKAIYYEKDITEVPEEAKLNFDLAFFDDHFSHYDRLLFCLENSIDSVILDDDVRIMTPHTDGWPPIPSASMIFNYEEIPMISIGKVMGQLAMQI